MRAPHDLSWAALLLSCAASSAVAALAVSLMLRHSQHLQQKPHSESTAIKKIRTSQLAAPASTTQPHSSTLRTPLHRGAPKPAIHVRDLAPDAVPLELRVDAYFAPHHLRAFAYHAVFDGCANVFAVLDAIHPYLERFFRERLWVDSPDAPHENKATILKASGKRDRDGQYGEGETGQAPWRVPECIDAAQATDIVLYPGVDPLTFVPDKILNLDSTASTKQIVVAAGARVLGGVLDVSAGSIYIGREVCIEPYVVIKGPCIIGDYSTVRSGAYLRGDLIIGSHVVLRGELKNALVMDRAELCHPGYCGDSICGYKSHFGNQVTTANLNLMTKHEIRLQAGDPPRSFNTGRKKMGVVLGDFAQLGCSSVTDPCTLLRPHTIVYPLTRLRKGIYGPHVIVKNKPLEKGVLEVAPLVPPPAETET